MFQRGDKVFYNVTVHLGKGFGSVDLQIEAVVTRTTAHRVGIMVYRFNKDDGFLSEIFVKPSNLESRVDNPDVWYGIDYQPLPE